MTGTVRRDGDAFQARMFWMRAARLLDPASPIAKVSFEVGPKSFDDIQVDYDAARAPRDQHGRPLLREHIQCKWHASPFQYGFAHLVDPDFINATAKSLLQRADAAHRGYGADGNGLRFKLLTNWRIDREDPLRLVVGTRSGALRAERLFDETTDASKSGRIRKAWREHLGVDDEALKPLAGALAFGEATDSLDDLRDLLDVHFAAVGLKRVTPSESAFPYDDLIFQWIAQGRSTFDRTSFRAACAGEGLLDSGQGERTTHGIKSFEHPIDRLEDRCADVLDLVPTFDDRYIRSDDDWAGRLYPELKAFLHAAASGKSRVRLALDAHATLAFAAGSVLDMKSGRAVEIEQRTQGRTVWASDDGLGGNTTLAKHRTVAARGAPELAVAVGLTHDVEKQVLAYVTRELPTVGEVLSLTPASGPGQQSVAGGQHSFDLAQAVVSAVRAEGAGEPRRVHLFIAAPNAFTFMLGQRHKALGRSVLYEFDFDGGRGGSYRRSLELPTSATRAATDFGP